jgi:hypothetical protein
MLRPVFGLLLLCLAACASEIVRQPSELSTAPQPEQKRYVTSRPATIRLDSGYYRAISAGTQFSQIGRIKQGAVLKPVNTSFTVEGAHMHEAYPVLHEERIVGFYLPVEKAFTPLSQSTLLFIEEEVMK